MVKTIEEKRTYQREYQRRKRAEHAASVELLLEGLRRVVVDDVHLNGILTAQKDFLVLRGSEIEEAMKRAKRPGAMQQDILDALDVGRRYEEDLAALIVAKNNDPIVMRANGRHLLQMYGDEQFTEFPDAYIDMAEHATFPKHSEDTVMMLKLLFSHLKWQEPLFHEYDY